MKLFKASTILSKIVGNEPQTFSQIRKTVEAYCFNRELKVGSLVVLNDSLKELLPEKDQKLKSITMNYLRGILNEHVSPHVEEQHNA